MGVSPLIFKRIAALLLAAGSFGAAAAAPLVVLRAVPTVACITPRETLYEKRINATGTIEAQNLSAADLAGGRIAVADLLVKTGLAPSKGEAKRLIQQGGVSVDDEKVSDFTVEIGTDAFEKGHVILKKGKKIYHKVLLG